MRQEAGCFDYDIVCCGCFLNPPNSNLKALLQ